MVTTPTPPIPPTPPDNSAIDNPLKYLREKVAEAYNDITGKVTDMVGKLDTLTSETVGTMGTTRESVRALSIQFADALPSVAAMGGGLKDIAAMQQGIGTALGRNNVLSADVVSKLFAASKAISLSQEELSRAVSSFQDAGISSGVVATNMKIAVDFSRQMGVNTKVAFTLMTDNLDKLNEFGFESGIDGLAKMATTAASMRVTMTGVFNMAERAFNPEGAIEMVSAFQRLGVAAGDLADPFRLMFLAQNDTEELQNQVVQMTEKFTYFDEKSKTFKVFPYAKQDLRDLATATNMSYDDLIKYSIGASKLKEIGKDIRIGGISEKDKNFITNMAEFNEDQKGFTVTLDTGTKLVSQLNQEDIAKIKPKPETLEDIGKASMNFTKTIDTNVAAIAAKIVGGIATSGPAMDITEVSRGIARGVLETAGGTIKPVQDTRRGTERVVGSIAGAAEKMITGEFNMSDVMKGISTMTADIAKNMENAFSNIDFNKALNIAGKEISPNNELINSINRLTDRIDMSPIPNRTTVTPTGASPAVFEVKPITQTTNVKFDQLSLNVNGTIKLEGNGMNSDMMASQFFANNGQYRGQLEKIIQDTINNMKQPTYTGLPSTA